MRVTGIESARYMRKLVISDLVVTDYNLVYLIVKFDGSFENARSNRLLVTSGLYCTDDQNVTYAYEKCQKLSRNGDNELFWPTRHSSNVIWKEKDTPL